MTPDDSKISCKIIVVGDSGVGKTCLMNRFCKGSYSATTGYTVGINYEQKSVSVHDKEVNMIIWDTAGQEKFFAITKAYYRYATAVIFVYDVTCSKTLFNMEKWINVVQKEAPEDVIKLLVGHKCDKERSKQVSTSEGQMIADYYGMLFCEVSSKDNFNVDSSFYLIAQMVVELQENRTSQNLAEDQDSIILENEENLLNNSQCFLTNMYDWLYSLFIIDNSTRT